MKEIGKGELGNESGLMRMKGKKTGESRIKKINQRKKWKGNENKETRAENVGRKETVARKTKGDWKEKDKWGKESEWNEWIKRVGILRY